MTEEFTSSIKESPAPVQSSFDAHGATQTNNIITISTMEMALNNKSYYGIIQQEKEVDSLVSKLTVVSEEKTVAQGAVLSLDFVWLLWWSLQLRLFFKASQKKRTCCISPCCTGTFPQQTWLTCYLLVRLTSKLPCRLFSEGLLLQEQIPTISERYLN